MEYIEKLGANAKASSGFLAGCGTKTKNLALGEIARLLNRNADYIIEENKRDIENARKNGMSEAMIDRLTLNENRIRSMVAGIEGIIALPDPIGEVLGGGDLPNGLQVIKKRVPMGGGAMLQGGQRGHSARRFGRDKLKQGADNAYEGRGVLGRRSQGLHTACGGYFARDSKCHDEAE